MTGSKGTALVTGASSGIGAVYAKKLAQRGYDLVLVARRADRLAEIAEQLRRESGRKVDVLPADLTQAADIARVEARLGGDPAITLLVNNAGSVLKGGVLANGPEAIATLIALNVTAPTRLAASAAKAFAARRSGAIVNISSVLALAPELLEGVYSGSKAFILNLSLKLAADLAESGVRVQVVLPGATRTEIWDHAGTDIDAAMPDQVMDAGDLVDAALVGLERGEVVTIPPLADEGQWQAYTKARVAMLPNLSRRDVAERYRQPTAAAA